MAEFLPEPEKFISHSISRTRASILSDDDTVMQSQQAEG
jgi:hypothetical protein